MPEFVAVVIVANDDDDHVPQLPATVSRSCSMPLSPAAIARRYRPLLSPAAIGCRYRLTVAQHDPPCGVWVYAMVLPWATSAKVNQ